MRKYPKILIAAPQNRVKDYAMQEWYDAVRALDYPKNKIGIFLADNSDDDTYAQELNKKYNIDVVWSPPAGRSIVQRMAESHNLCRDHALKYGYDFLLHLETDVLPEPGTLLKLVFARKNIVGALYQIRGTTHPRHIMAQLVEPHPSFFGASVYTVEKDACWFADGTVREVFHAGLGCILIHRSVLDGFMFRYDDNVKVHPDTFFAQDMHAQGNLVHLHTGTFCRHWQKDAWDMEKAITPIKSIS